MHQYKITIIAMTVSSWDELRTAVFGSSAAVFEQYGGNVGEFHFATPQTPTDLGPLVRVEVIPSP